MKNVLVHRQLSWVWLREAASGWIAKVARWSGVVGSVCSLAFVILSHVGFWNYLRGDNLTAQVAANFDYSYSANASQPVRPGDPAWKPLIRIITKYTSAKLPAGRQPLVVARYQALASVDTAVGEWTAPTTPIYVFYTTWPKPYGGTISSPDFVKVGTIQDLHDWVHQDEVDFDYLWKDVIFSVLSICVGLTLALRE